MLSQEQRDRRRQSIGGSDIGVIAGVNPYKSAYDLYLEKIGEKADDAQNDAQYWGLLLEEPIAKFYSIQHQEILHAFTETLIHPDYPFLTANPDRVILDENGQAKRVIEIKTAGIGGIKHWHDQDSPGKLRPPDYVSLQANWYAGFLECQEIDIVLLHFCESFDTNRYVEFRMDFDPELFRLSVEMAVDFWQNHVMPQNPPLHTCTPKEFDHYLQRKFQESTEEIIESTAELDQLASKYAHASHQEDFWHRQKTMLANLFKQAIGEKSGIMGKNWICRWVPIKSGGVDWRALAASKNPSYEELKQFERPGYRRLYFRMKEQVDDIRSDAL
jgi:putative phage-type endonuclease